MKIIALNYFMTVNEFLQYSQVVEQNEWKIEKQLLKDRVECYQSITIFKELSMKFHTEKLSIWPLKQEEVITWIDTLTIMRRVYFSLFKLGIHQEKIITIMEYPLVNGNYMRTDYLLVYDRLIFVLEFGMFNQDEKRSEERYTKKLQESINYRQIIANQVSSKTKVINYTMIYRPEFDRHRKVNIDENITYNTNEINRLVNFVFHNVKKQDQEQAIMQLEQLYHD